MDPQTRYGCSTQSPLNTLTHCIKNIRKRKHKTLFSSAPKETLAIGFVFAHFLRKSAKKLKRAPPPIQELSHTPQNHPLSAFPVPTGRACDPSATNDVPGRPPGQRPGASQSLAIGRLGRPCFHSPPGAARFPPTDEDGPLLLPGRRSRSGPRDRGPCASETEAENLLQEPRSRLLFRVRL